MTTPPPRPVERGVAYGTDLGKLDPACTAKRHGTTSAYRHGCRCPHARDAHRLYQKRHREGRNKPRLVDATGVRRRIQALWAIGHTSQTIAGACGPDITREQVYHLTSRAAVTSHSWEAIDRAYKLLSSRPGTSTKTRSRAAAAGYPSPMRWGADIDDPRAKPDPVGAGRGRSGIVDVVAVSRALEGEKVQLSAAEQTAALRLAVGRGESLSRASNQLGINYFGARKLLAGDLTPRREQQARVEAALAQMGATHPASTIAALLGVHHQTVLRAKRRLAERQEQLAS